MDKNFVDMLEAVESSAGKNELLIQALNYAAYKIEESNKLEADLAESNLALKKAEATIDRARKLYSEQKEELEQAADAVKKKIYKELQIVRDRIYVIGDTVSAYETRRKETGSEIEPVELNNIVASLELIINEMKALELWDEQDAVPNLSLIGEEPQNKGKNAVSEKAGVILEESDEDSEYEQMRLE